MIREFTVSLACVASLGAAPTAADADFTSPSLRFDNARIGEVVRLAGQRSATFRRLVHAIESAQGIVYISEGRCLGGRVRSCVRVSATPGVRFVVIHLDPRQQTLSVVGALAHELQHAVEIITTPGVTDTAAVERLYRRIGFLNCALGPSPCWETRDAQDVERLVVTETERKHAATADVDAAYFGTWTLNVARSTFDGVPAPRQSCRVNGDRGFGLLSIVTNTIDAGGVEWHESYVYRLDGHEYRLSAPDQHPRRTIMASAIDRFTSEYALKQDGVLVTTVRRTVDHDGLTLTESTQNADAEESGTRSVLVWEKQGTGRR